MALTATTTAPTAAPAIPEVLTKVRGGTRLWRTGLAAGLAASAATLGFAALARGLDVPLRVDGEAIPVVGFAQLTFVAAVIGTLLAIVLSHRASRPRRTFVVTTVALTVISFLPDVLADASTATKVALVVSHVIAAAIIVPALASRLSD